MAGNPISYADLFNFSNDADVQKALKNFDLIIADYEKLINIAKQGSQSISASQKAIIDSTNQLDKATKNLNETNKTDQKIIAEQNSQLKILTATYRTQQKQIETLNGQIKKLSTEKTAISKKQQDLNNINKEAIRLEAQIGKLTGQQAKEVAELKLQKSQLTKQLSLEAKAALGLVSIYDKEVAQLNKLQNQYREVALAQGINSKAAKELNATYLKQKARITDVNQSMGQFQDRVGNYKTAFTGLTSTLRNVGAALGFSGLIYGIVNAFKGAFNIVRTFDKSMVGLAAISGKSRDELSSLEKEIRRVAATSINTANDVASLAESLFTLGKSKKEVEDLLEPVNNLSIALQAPADAAGELLVKTLNAFGESTTEAQRYADVIAKMRTSTALDFEQIQNSLAYLAPTAKAVGLSIEKTGAILGVLVDNGIKAERAGRLMSSSFATLAVSGLSLEEALDKVNSSEDRVAMSAKIFGKQSFSLGLILADNKKKTDEYTKSFENAAGSLEKLTNDQLKSLDAQLSILSSSWTELILSIENGGGALNTFAINAVNFTSDFLNGLANIDLMFRVLFKDVDEISRKDLNRLFDLGLETESGKEVKDFIKLLENIPFEEVFNNQEKYMKSFTNSLMKEGETLNDSKAVFKAWFDQREIAFLAQKAFDSNIKEGITTIEQFNRSQKDVFLSTKDGAEKVEIITALYEEYAKKLAETTGEVKGIDKAMKAYKDTIESLFAFKQIEPIKDVNKVKDALEALKKFYQEFFNSESANLEASLDRNANLVSEALKERLEEAKKAADKELEIEKQLADKKAAIRQTSFEVASILGNQLFTNQQIRSENELKGFENQKDYELELAGDNAQQRAQIEADFARKEKQIRTQQAKDQRNQAVFNIALGTAQAVINALATVQPYPAAVVAAVSAGVIGAAQAAAVLSQPLPAFEKGGLVETDGKIITSEKGSEMYIDKHGKIGFTGDKGAEIRTGMKGSTIIPADITQDIVKKGFDYDKINRDSSSNVLSVIQAEKERNSRALIDSINNGNSALIDTFNNVMSKVELHQYLLKNGDIEHVVQKGMTKRTAWGNKNKN